MEFHFGNTQFEMQRDIQVKRARDRQVFEAGARGVGNWEAVGLGMALKATGMGEIYYAKQRKRPA